MADLDVTQMTQLAVAPAADDVVYIGDVSEGVLDDQNKHIEIQDLFKYLDGVVQVDIVLNTAATLDLILGAVHLNEAVDLVATSTQLNAIAALSGGDFTNFAHTHADAANGGQLTSPLVNEAVALLATATELNQLDGVSVGGATAGDIVTIDATQTLTAKTLTTPTIGDFINAGHDHSSAAEGGGIVRTVELQVYDPTTAAAVANDLVAFVVPPTLNGFNLTNVIVGVTVLGTTGTQDVMVHRRRSGSNADMLSTVVTVSDAEYFAQDGVIDTANDDVNTGDTIAIDVDAIHTTPATGTFVTLEFTLP